MQTSHRRMQTSVDKSRRVQTNRKMFQKKFPEKNSRKSDTWSYFVFVAIMQQQAIQVCKFSFVVLSVIIVPQNVLFPHISKIHLPFISLNVSALELNLCSKEQSMKKEFAKLRALCTLPYAPYVPPYLACFRALCALIFTRLNYALCVPYSRAFKCD